MVIIVDVCRNKSSA